ncbi:EF-hand domain-containing protein [Mariprofundus aestuarium]|nr:EF-hand domain-containing protein [Mariprofundus aestuarium]
MKKFVLFAGFMMLATSVQAAFMPSYDPQETADRVMKVKDANHDGVIDPAEFEAMAVHKFKEIDTSGDGVISGDEMFAHRYAGRSEMDIKTPAVKKNIINNIMKRWDHDKDGQISKDEKLEPARNEFMRIDRDLDHKITRDELVSHWERKLRDLKKSQDEASGKDGD